MSNSRLKRAIRALLRQHDQRSMKEEYADDRYADDIHINREMREVERWNDPAAEFLTVCPTFLDQQLSAEFSIVSKADHRREGRRRDLDDLNIMAQVLLIDSISYQDLGGMELVCLPTLPSSTLYHTLPSTLLLPYLPVDNLRLR